ncbi:hypothetical protein ABIB26_001378 [Arthrobacter sp. UYEF20]
MNGASAGNIIAAIISVHTARNRKSPSPIVPGPADMPPKPEKVMYHASAAHPINASSPAWWLTVR